MTTPRHIVLLLLLAVAGCDLTDPYQREGNWRPNNANDANLRAMVVLPSDLIVAAPVSPNDGALAAAAVSRLNHDRVRQLPDSGVLQVTPVASGASAAAPAPTGTGN